MPPQIIEEYAQTEVVRKALANVRYHAERMRDIRGSPDRYNQVQAKLHTQGRHSPHKQNSTFQPAPDKSKGYSLAGASPSKKKKDAEMREKLRKDVMSYEDKHGGGEHDSLRQV